jgi:hypothetical protein
MKLSDNTITILKNFSNINQSILVKQGSQIKTISILKNIYAVADVDEEFGKDFAIYDLNEFLNGLSLHQDPDLDFTNDSYLTIKEGKRRVKYFYADPEVIVSPPDKELNLKQTDVSFRLTNAVLNKLLRLASMNNLTHLSVVGKNGEIRLQTHEKANDTSNLASFKLNDYEGEDFCASFKVDNIKLIPGDYDVEMQLGAFAKFTAVSGLFKDKIKYFIALESK